MLQEQTWSNNEQKYIYSLTKINKRPQCSAEGLWRRNEKNEEKNEIKLYFWY